MKLQFNLTYNYARILKMEWYKSCHSCQYFDFKNEHRGCYHPDPPVTKDLSHMICYDNSGIKILIRYDKYFKPKQYMKKL